MKKTFLTLLILLLLGGVGFWWYQNNGNGSSSNTDATGAVDNMPVPIESDTTSARIPPAGYAVYENPRYHFSFFYPSNLKGTQYGGTGQQMTLSFEDPQTGKGFQIFVTPYNVPQITEERFKKDVPSGVRLEPTDVLIDGTRGTMFFSKNAQMGDSREVWFIRGGLLYEVTTYKELDAWLSQIMQSWKFL